MPTSPHLHFGSPSQRAPALALRLLIANPTAATAVPATPQAALEEAPALAEADAVARRCPTALSWRLICLTKSNIHWNKQSIFRFFNQWDADVSSQFSCISGMNWWINGHHPILSFGCYEGHAAACREGQGRSRCLRMFCWNWATFLLTLVEVNIYWLCLFTSSVLTYIKT